jgi:DNA-binding NarL/FixJ family response regulator
MNSTIRLFLVDGNEILREGIVGILSKHEGIELVGTTSNEAEVIRLVEQKHPDIVLIGPTMKDAKGVQIIKDIRERFEDTHCILLTDVSAQDRDVVFEAIKSGASGCFPMTVTSESFVEGIRSVFRGGTLLSPQDTTKVLQRYHELAQGRKAGENTLSFREREVVLLIAQGLSNKQIAYKLRISTKTVKTHVAHIMKKMRAKNRTEAVALAIRKGLIKIEMEKVPGSGHMKAGGCTPHGDQQPMGSGTRAS